MSTPAGVDALTTNYEFYKIEYEYYPWHTLDWRNWDLVDTTIKALDTAYKAADAAILLQLAGKQDQDVYLDQIAALSGAVNGSMFQHNGTAWTLVNYSAFFDNLFDTLTLSTDALDLDDEIIINIDGNIRKVANSSYVDYIESQLGLGGFNYHQETAPDPTNIPAGRTWIRPSNLNCYYLRANPIDGTKNWAQFNASIDVGQKSPPVFVISATGLMQDSEWIGSRVYANFETVPANLVGSFATALTAPTATTVITLRKRDTGSASTTTDVGTITFAVGQKIATFATTGGASFSMIPGNVLEVYGPTNADATLSDVSISILGTR